ncbi:MAG: BMP family ABC transporter substrate-binding protein [Chloroflexi bacterium]|nr:BMP family ABC transporter substrate-binding protein [Chloroflexota bacterium]
MRKNLLYVAFLALILVLAVSACGPKPTEEAPPEEPVTTDEPVATEPVAVEPEEFIFGFLLVGPYNDHGWSQAHYEAGLYVEENIPGARMIYIENVYDGSPDHPGITASQLAEELVAQGAKLVIFNSDAHQDEAIKFAQENPEIFVIHASGDSAWAEGERYQPIANLTDIMGRMEYGKMMAGCAAALTSQTGKIGYIGPLINDETRRLAASAYLGAKYCWTNYLGRDAADLTFKVTWIGFWFYVPGFSSDPTLVADEFVNTGFDVLISGIDTTEGLTEAKRFTESGQQVWAIPYDYIGSCEEGASVCLGVPYYNWGPAYMQSVAAIIDNSWTASFQWNGPDWADINDPDTSAIGYVKGPALSAEASADLDAFIAELAGGLNLWTGPISLQDGTVYLADGVVATDQEVWYLPQLLLGMEGLSE